MANGNNNNNNKDLNKLSKSTENVTKNANKAAQDLVDNWGKIRKEINQALQDHKDLNTETGQWLNTYGDLLSATEQRAIAESDVYDKSVQALDNYNKQVDALQAQHKIDIENLKLLEIRLKGQKDITDQDHEQLRLSRERIRDFPKIMANHRKVVDGLKKELDERKKNKRVADEINAGTKEAIGLGENWAKSLLGVSKQSEIIGKKLGRDGVLGTSKQILGAFRKQVTATNLIGAAFTKVFEGIKKGVSDLGQFATQNFGFGAAFQTEYATLDEFQIRAREVGKTSAESFAEYQSAVTNAANDTIFTRRQMIESYNALFKSSEAFRQATGAEQEAQIELAKTLEMTTGTSLQNTGTAVQNLTLAFGKSRPEAERITSQFALTARTLKMDVNKAFSDFAAQTNNLAKFGLPDVENQFFRLSKVQEKTGVSMDKMISTMERFTTFEGALGAAATLNAVFGSTIDGMELMDVTMEEGPLKGFVKLREQMEASGMQIDQMNYSQFRVLQQQLGLTAQELKQLGSVSVEELQKIANEDPFLSTADAMKQLQADAGDVRTPTEKLADATDELAKSLNGVVGWFRELKGDIADFVKDLGPLGSVLTSIFVSGGPILVGMGLMLLKVKAYRAAWAMFQTGAAKSALTTTQLARASATAGQSFTYMGTQAQGAGFGVRSLSAQAQMANSQIMTLGNTTTTTSTKMGGLMNKMKAAGPMIASMIAMIGGSLLASKSQELKDSGHGGLGVAANVAGQAAMYGGMGYSMFGPKGAIVGAGFGAAKAGIEERLETMDDPAGMYDIDTGERLASGLNFASNPHRAIVGEAGEERITNRTQRLLQPGSAVTPISGQGSGATEMNLTVNLVTQDGKTVSSNNFRKSFDADEGTVRSMIEATLDEKLNLIYG